MAAMHRTSAHAADHRGGDAYGDDRRDVDLSPEDPLAQVGRRVLEPDTVERESAGFDLQMRGYSRDQVEHRIAEWATAYDAIELERDQLLAEVQELRDRPQQLTPLESMSARVQQIVAAAEQEAAELSAAIHVQAEALLADAHATAEADREAAAQERTVAAGEAQRWLSESRERAKQLMDEATEEAARLRAEATAQADELGTRTAEHATEIRAMLAAEEEQVLAGARAEAAELARTTTRQREIAEAEHTRLLAAHASQQKATATALRAQLQELQGRRDEAQVEVDQLRQRLSFPAGARSGVEQAPVGGTYALGTPAGGSPDTFLPRPSATSGQPSSTRSRPLDDPSDLDDDGLDGLLSHFEPATGDTPVRESPLEGVTAVDPRAQDALDTLARDRRRRTADPETPSDGPPAALGEPTREVRRPGH